MFHHITHTELQGTRINLLRLYISRINRCGQSNYDKCLDITDVTYGAITASMPLKTTDTIIIPQISANAYQICSAILFIVC